MGKAQISTIFLGLLCWIGSSFVEPVLEDQPVIQRSSRLREKFVALAESQLHVREATGNNDGREVEMFLRSVGLKKGQPWCAAFVSWLHIENNVPNPESGYSPDWFRANVVYAARQPRITPFESRPAQVFGLYYESKKRIAHVGIITGETRLHYETIEGNTNTAGSNEGDGVYRKIRKKETIYMISDFVGYQEVLKALKNNEKQEKNGTRKQSRKRNHSGNIRYRVDRSHNHDCEPDLNSTT
jgi:hypothetical protein